MLHYRTLKTLLKRKITIRDPSTTPISRWRGWTKTQTVVYGLKRKQNLYLNPNLRSKKRQFPSLLLHGGRLNLLVSVNARCKLLISSAWGSIHISPRTVSKPMVRNTTVSPAAVTSLRTEFNEFTCWLYLSVTSVDFLHRAVGTVYDVMGKCVSHWSIRINWLCIDRTALTQMWAIAGTWINHHINSCSVVWRSFSDRH